MIFFTKLREKNKTVNIKRYLYLFRIKLLTTKNFVTVISYIDQSIFLPWYQKLVWNNCYFPSIYWYKSIYKLDTLVCKTHFLSLLNEKEKMFFSILIAKLYSCENLHFLYWKIFLFSFPYPVRAKRFICSIIVKNWYFYKTRGENMEMTININVINKTNPISHKL